MRRSRTAAVAQVRRARLILMLDGGASRSAIKHELRYDLRAPGASDPIVRPTIRRLRMRARGDISESRFDYSFLTF